MCGRNYTYDEGYFDFSKLSKEEMRSYMFLEIPKVMVAQGKLQGDSAAAAEMYTKTHLVEGQSNEDDQQVVSFAENVGSVKVMYDPIQDRSFYTDESASASLGSFLSRPVPIADFSWTMPNLADQSIRPWQLFFNNAAIKRKLDNYAFMNCNLHVKIFIKATPFLYGSVRAAYVPAVGMNPLVLAGVTNARVALSQLPGFMIYPAESTTGEMMLPFFHERNWLDITKNSELLDMGELRLWQYTALQSSDGSTGQTVNIQVVAWAENVRVAAPTVKAALQGDEEQDDEYGNGIVSLPASAIASVGRLLSNVPVIGRYARATEIGASAVSKIASLFGFTNVPVVENVEPYKSMVFGGLASAHTSQPMSKLTIDPKNELTIDPRTVGLSGDDELAVSNFVQRESWFCTADWTTAQNPSDLLFSTSVLPQMHTRDPSGSNFIIHETPMALVSHLFKSWRGDIIYRFKVVCSKFHKGKLKVSWDPVGNNIANDPDLNLNYTKVVDIENSVTEFEVRVNYLQTRQWLKTWAYGGAPWWYTSGFSFEHREGSTNGTLTIRVFSKLSAPDPAASVKILCFCRGAENLEFADPTELTDLATFFPLQGEEVMEPIHLQMGDPSGTDPERFKLNFGEAVPSLRTLLRRASRVDTIGFNDHNMTDTDTHSIIRISMTKYPPAPGYDPSGFDTARNQANTTNVPYNFTENNPFNWIAQCFSGMRGSMIWHFNVDNNLRSHAPRQYISINRIRSVIVNQVDYINLTTANSSDTKRFFQQFLDAGSAGLALTNGATQAGLSASLPHYNINRMISANPGTYGKGAVYDDSDEDAFRLNLVFKGPGNAKAAEHTTLTRMCSIGTDFTLFFFRCVPSSYSLTAVPAAGT